MDKPKNKLQHALEVMEARSKSSDDGGADRIKGVFSSEVAAYVGHGATKRKIKREVHMFAQEDEHGKITIQSLNENWAPSGDKKVISRERLLKDYLPEPGMYINKVYPAMEQLAQHVSMGEQRLGQGEIFTAEFEFKNALRINEKHVRATFGLGLTYMEQGQINSAELVFRRLVKLEGAFEQKHKHLFNDFGIQLRKNKMYDEALQFYFRGYKLSQNDENLLYNIGRTLVEKGRKKSARFFLEKAMRINQNFEEGRTLLNFVKKKTPAPAPETFNFIA